MTALGLLHLAGGIALVAAGWLIPRRLARARRTAAAALLLDLMPLAVGGLLLGCATGRPLFAGCVILALGAGFTLADYAMRETLREPVVFSAMSELPQVFTHPHLYLPFAGPGLVIGGAAAAIVLALTLLVVEPPLWTPHPLTALAAAALLGLGGHLLSREPLLGRAAGRLRRLAASGEPDADAAALGPFAMLLVQTIVARAERQPRQRALAARPMGRARAAPDAPAGPIVLVQCESFFDARRLSPRIPHELLAGFDTGRAAALSGRLEVPGWGANTMRSEFAVLTGLPESALGYDRFNPYHALARVPLESQVWRLRRAGYRTICLHPFDRRFFRRDVVMPALGFDAFLGRETLGGSRVPPYCPDPELARQILRVLDEAGPHTFIFAITMGNHGPWPAVGPTTGPVDPAVARLFGPAAIPGGGDLLRYLDGLRASDEMLQVLLDGLGRRAAPSVLGFYGDHLPSLSPAFRHFGFEEPHSDYLVWRNGGRPQRRDLQAHQLGRIIVDAALGAAPARDLEASLAPPEPARLLR